MNYGKAFKQIRIACGLTRTEVSKALKCTPSSLSKIENGRVLPKNDTIKRFCEALRVPLAYLYINALEASDFGVGKPILVIGDIVEGWPDRPPVIVRDE